MATVEEITEALKDVYDPEIGVNIVDLGLVYNVEQEDSRVDVQMTLTSMGCPAGPILVSQVEEVVGSLDGVEDVGVEIVWSPAWNPSMMSEDAKLELGFA
ncbi:MAG: metal-sulfur cluster assembly factor [Chloroflexota bacterium]|nr:metal-sulfur cluster assembly factor [Chloroflexota bacterium]